ETPSRRIIVDTCLGNDKENRRIPTWNKLQTRFMADLATAGYQRETIDTVICTHLHVDHVGWNTMLIESRWVPTFPNARYLVDCGQRSGRGAADARPHVGPPRQCPDPGHRHAFRRPNRRPDRARRWRIPLGVKEWVSASSTA